MVVRLEGTNVEKARDNIKGVKAESQKMDASQPGLTEAAKMVVAAAQ